MAKKEIKSGKKNSPTKQKSKKKEIIIIVAVALVLALIDVALVMAVLKHNDGQNRDGGTTEQQKEIEFPKYTLDGASGEGKFYDTSKTGHGVDVDMDKVTAQIGAYDYNDFILSSIPTDFVVVRIENYGDIVIALREDIAPVTVNNFKALVLKDFYNNTVFHRVVNNLLIQGGSRDKSGEKKTANNIIGEFISNGHENHLSHIKGVVSMSRDTDNNSAGSEFFITHGRAVNFDNEYAAFGYVIAGLDVLDAIAKSEVKASETTGEKSVPTTQIVIKDVFFVEPKAGTGIASNQKSTDNSEG